MLSRLKLLDFSRSCKNCINVRLNTNSTESNTHNKKDTTYLYNLFFKEDIQNRLKILTHIDEAKVFQFRAVGDKMSHTKYKLLTTKELKNKKNEMRRKIKKLMQMPPVLSPRPEKINKILDKHPGLDGHDLDHAKLIFIDISENYQNEERIIVVRDPDGILREAEYDERNRINQIFFPMPCRKLYTPQMFEDKYLKKLLDKKEYIFILDRACAQFEPDDPKYIEVTSKTYDEINKNKDFELLHSTRHFGSLTFYLVMTKNIDNMLHDNIQSERIADVFILLSLYNDIHNFNSEGKVEEELLQSYIALESKEKLLLELMWQTYKSKIKKLKENNVKEEVVI